MEMNFEYRGIGKTARILLIASAAFLVSAQGTGDPLTDEAIVVCTDALVADYGAIELSDISHTRRSGHRSVYATARLASGETPRFRCVVRLGNDILRVEVFADGGLSITRSKSGWISAEPYRVKPEPDAEVPAEITPEQEPKKSEAPLEIDPEFKTPGTGTEFKTPGTGTGFKTPGTGTGFKTPGTGTGSQFKPAK